MKSAASHRPLILVLAVLALLVVMIFGQAVTFEFVHYDDNAYVFSNPHVREGLALSSIRWALSSTENSLWLPLTRLSYLIDSELAGISAGWFHGVNVLVHVVNTLLLFFVLRGMTGAFWRSAAAAALFSLHPLRVESVVWVTERKDMLSMCMLLLSLVAYLRYIRRGSNRSYAGSVAFFGASLMAKPMAVMFPVLLVILDRWPLGRWGNIPVSVVETKSARRTFSRTFRGLLLEKVPYLVLSAGIALVTIIANRGALKSDDVVPLTARLINATVSPVRYLLMMVWPTDLAFFYPYEVGWLSPVAVIGSIAVLAGVTIACVIIRKRAPYCLAGWLWYLIALTPVLGIVQAGSQSHADRFTYLPMIGIVVLVVWGVTEFTDRMRQARAIRVVLFITALMPLMILSARQARTWRSSEALFSHAVADTDNNYIAHLNYANLLLSEGEYNDAVSHYREALRIRPSSGPAHFNIGTIMLRARRYEDAISHFNQALPLFPGNPIIHRSLAAALTGLGRTDEAARHEAEARRIMQSTSMR